MLARNLRHLCRLPVQRSVIAKKSAVRCICVSGLQMQGSSNHDSMGLHVRNKGSLVREIRFFSSSPRYLTQKENESQEEAVPVSERIEKLVKRNKVVIFMKGVPEEPRCGFSNAVVQVLRMHGVENYDAHNVLADEELRQGIKDYSDWPTIPQVYFEGEFIGGCDILLQMHQNGELIEELGKLGIKSELDKTA